MQDLLVNLDLSLLESSIAFEAEVVVEFHLSLFPLETHLTFPEERDWDVESAPAFECHLELALVVSSNVHVGSPECLMQAESDLFEKLVRRKRLVTFLCGELDEHGPFVNIFVVASRRASLVLIPECYDYRL